MQYILGPRTAAYAVYGVLCRLAGDGDAITIHEAALANLAGIASRTVGGAIITLEAKRLLHVERRRGYANTYRVWR